MNIADILSKVSKGELSEEQVTGLEKALNQHMPDMADTWAIVLKVLPGITPVLGGEKTEDMRTMLLRYVTARLRGAIGADMG